MKILGIQGSPRKKGNSEYLLNEFLGACRERGADTRIIRADSVSVQPCRELIVCEKKGYCPIRDDMEPEIYGLIRRADVVVLASPVFFYNVSAQLKVVIDRCQMFWGRKYKCQLSDPWACDRKGVLLSVAASRGKRLFEGVNLTARYFFDAISADFSESLTYPGVEAAGAIRDVPDVASHLTAAADRIMARDPALPTVIFVSGADDGVGPMAAAFAKRAAGPGMRVYSAGMSPSRDLVPGLEALMASRGVDIRYRLPRSLEHLVAEEGISADPPQTRVISLDAASASVPGAEPWDIPGPDLSQKADAVQAWAELLVTDMVGR